MNQDYIRKTFKGIIISKIRNNNNYLLKIEKICLSQQNKMKAKWII